MQKPLSSIRSSPLAWFCLLYVAVFAVRSVGTLVGGEATWSTPGTGWRSVWQLIMIAICLVGLLSPARLRLAVGTVVVVYALATVSELIDPRVLVGAIPVDMRDRWVHPLVAVLGATALVAVARRRSPDSSGAQRVS